MAPPSGEAVELELWLPEAGVWTCRRHLLLGITASQSMESEHGSPSCLSLHSSLLELVLVVALYEVTVSTL